MSKVPADYLRKLARGKECTIRLPGVCNHNTETTVGAHYRLIGYSGAGLKMPDIHLAWSCSACHDAVDGRTSCEFSRNELHLMHLEGVLRTQAQLQGMGVLKVAAVGRVVCP